MSVATPAVYIHIPFCLSRCSYCTFFSSIYTPSLADRYIEALHKEIQLRLPSVLQKRPSSLFIGGGTPSSLTEQQLEKLFSKIPLPANDDEATIEMNPDSVTQEKVSLLLASGINRISFGVQTFDAAGLQLLERRHTAKEAEQNIRSAIKAGAENISIDLITAWPGQTLSGLKDDICRAVDLGVKHISCYTLIVEPDSRIYSTLRYGQIKEYDDVEQRSFWDSTIEILSKFGFIQYEVSNFCRPGYECRHNCNTWMGGEYAGIGAAAHSHLKGCRSANIADIESYIQALESGKQPPLEFSEVLTKEDKAKECAIFWLRLKQGIDIEAFFQRTGMDIFTLYGSTLQKFLDDDLMEEYVGSDGKKKLKVCEEYFPMLDSLLIDLL